jgi:hypothetical protein
MTTWPHGGQPKQSESDPLIAFATRCPERRPEAAKRWKALLLRRISGANPQLSDLGVSRTAPQLQDLLVCLRFCVG